MSQQLVIATWAFEVLVQQNMFEETEGIILLPFSAAVKATVYARSRSTIFTKKFMLLMFLKKKNLCIYVLRYQHLT